MAVFDGRIIVVCFAASWVDSTELVSLLVFLTRKRLTNSEQWARRTAAHCAFTSYQLPYKRPSGGGIKGRDAGTLSRFFLYSSSRPFSRPEKGGFKPLRIVPERLLWKGGPHKDTARCFKRRVRPYDFVHSDWWQRRKSRLRQIIWWIFWVPFYFGCTVTGRSAAPHAPVRETTNTSQAKNQCHPVYLSI